MYVATQLFKHSEPRAPLVKGSMSSSGEVWCYWLHDFNGDALTVLRLVVPQGGDMLQDTGRLMVDPGAW